MRAPLHDRHHKKQQHHCTQRNRQSDVPAASQARLVLTVHGSCPAAEGSNMDHVLDEQTCEQRKDIKKGKAKEPARSGLAHAVPFVDDSKTLHDKERSKDKGHSRVEWPAQSQETWKYADGRKHDRVGENLPARAA